MRYAWLTWSLILLAVWSVVYVSTKDRESRREMLVVSAVTSLFGLTEPIFVPAYWTPPSLFDLAARTRFDIESVLFSFGIGGLAVVIYEALWRGRHVTMPADERMAARHRLHLVALVSAPATFVILFVVDAVIWQRLNPIYTTCIAFVAGALFTLYCRPDLLRKMLASAAVFLALYFAYFWTLTLAFPDYVRQVWNLPALSGILIAGIPVEELLFAATFGLMWSSVYEHIMWRRVTST